MGKIEERPGKVSFGQAWRDFFVGYVDFKGRSTRAGYWWIRLFTIILGYGTGIALLIPLFKVDLASNGNPSDQEITRAVSSMAVPIIILFIISLALMLPTLALAVRRIRDVGLRGRGQLVIIGVFILFSIIFAPNLAQILNGDVSSLTRYYLISAIYGVGFFILTVLPTGTLTTTQESGIMAFFFKNKRFYEDSEL